ncbi:lauroyl acyltransferase [Halieaceae bacterium IMCC14734]|uniref:Lauroyl acyltransferase n=1 Tax=Candidatus Litorirhabdus singularis TaxID=2518993 RepID=A0ABT3TL22_9GAMM|nr:hypothetical protein [Candidatus Litorirhabdus singularis]MCX2982441.1 lauroyl acyltransferase [Candidatus Litorirhabdus singularis]
MAEYILGNSLSKAASKHKFLRALLWRLDFAVVWLLINLFALLPTDTASNLGERLGRFIGPRLRRKTELYRENLAIAFPEQTPAEREALLVRSWGRAGRVLAEYPHFNRIAASKDRERLHIRILQDTPTYSDEHAAAVIVTAHHSNWEMVGSAMGRLGIPNSTLYSPPTNPLLDRMLLASRMKLNCELVPRDKAARSLVKALARGRSAGMVMDRRIDGGHPIPFFGRPKPSTLLPAKLALKNGIDLIPARVERRQGAEFEIIFYPPITARNPEASEDDRAVDMVTQVHELFEEWIRAEPADWFCSKRIWPKMNAQDGYNAPTATEARSNVQ